MQVVHVRDGFDVYGGRPRGGKRPQDCKPGKEEGWLGNPYLLKSEADRTECIAAYKLYFWRRVNADTAFREAVMSLRGKRVACFCSPKACHLSVVKAWLNAGCPLK